MLLIFLGPQTKLNNILYCKSLLFVSLFLQVLEEFTVVLDLLHPRCARTVFTATVLKKNPKLKVIKHAILLAFLTFLHTFVIISARLAATAVDLLFRILTR